LKTELPESLNKGYLSSMKLALLYPQFAPNLYDLAAMLQADCIILQDVEPWSRKSRIHRAKIRAPEGTQWINIPVKTADRNKPIHQVRIDHERDWIAPLLRSIEYNYRNSIYYDFYEPEIKADFESAREYIYLQPFALTIQERLFRFMDIRVEAMQASKLKSYTSDPDQLARQMGANQLFQEHKSRHYQRQARVKSDPVFAHPAYRQHFEGFEPWCCVLDLLFQYGPESFRIIDRLKAE
jgi:hypothetical protein